MELRKWNYLLPASVNHMGRWFLAVKTNDLNIDIKQNRKKEQQKEAWSSRSRNFLSARGLTSPRGFTKSKGTSHISTLQFIIHHPHREQSEDVKKNQKKQAGEAPELENTHVWFIYLKEGELWITRRLVEALGWTDVMYVMLTHEADSPHRLQTWRTGTIWTVSSQPTLYLMWQLENVQQMNFSN